MATTKGYSRSNGFGTTTHYDAKGKKIGSTSADMFGATHYDEKGRKIGTSSPNFFGGETIYDAKGKKIGSTSPGFFSTVYYDASGRKVDSTSSSFGGSTTNNSYLSNRYENTYDAERRQRAMDDAYRLQQSEQSKPYYYYPDTDEQSASPKDGSAIFCEILGGAFVALLIGCAIYVVLGALFK